MPFGGDDWLALTPEATLEPEITICDPRHHFSDHRTERGPYQRYLLHEFASDNMGGQLSSDNFRPGARVLPRMGPSLGGWLYSPQLPALAEGPLQYIHTALR